MGHVFFSKHRKNTIELVNKDMPGGVEIIRFRPQGMIGMVTVNKETAGKMREHKLFQSNKSERGTFYEQKPVVPEKNNIVQGAKGAGSVIMDNSTNVPPKTDDKKVASPPKKGKKKNSKKK